MNHELKDLVETWLKASLWEEKDLIYKFQNHYFSSPF